GSGVVLDWTPKDQQVEKGTAVNLVVSAGSRRVPTDLIGKSFDAVKAELAAMGLVAVPVNGYSDDVKTGQVFDVNPPVGSIDTNPTAGTPVKRGTSVDLFVR